MQEGIIGYGRAWESYNNNNDLEIVNPKEQYEYLAEFVNQVPSDINVYIMPGNPIIITMTRKVRFGSNSVMLGWNTPATIRAGTMAKANW